MVKMSFLMLAAAVAGCAAAPAGGYSNSPVSYTPKVTYYKSSEPVIRNYNGDVMAVGTADVNRFMQSYYVPGQSSMVSYDSPRAVY